VFAVDLIIEHQTVDSLAQTAGTIGYEILTSQVGRYAYHYVDN
jgi:alanine racemase